MFKRFVTCDKYASCTLGETPWPEDSDYAFSDECSHMRGAALSSPESKLFSLEFHKEENLFE